MTALLSQEQFEELLKSPKPAPLAIVYFTAKWCGPCKAMKLGKVLDAHTGVDWYLCDMDDNDYTPGYCGVKSIPSFLAIINGKPFTPIYKQSDADKVIEWVSAIKDL